MVNRLILIAIVCLISIQAALVAGRLLLLFKAPDFLAQRLLPEWAPSVYPKWDLALFVFFAACAVGGQALALKAERGRMASSGWRRGALAYLAAEAVLTFFMVSAVYKATIYDHSPMLAQGVFIVLAIMALGLKLFWPEINGALPRLKAAACRISGKPYAFLTAAPGRDAAALAAIVLILYVPDLEAVLAQMFIGEQFHHFDFFLMTPGWAFLGGQLPYVGAISQYGVGVPASLSQLTALFGGFDYLPALKMIVAWAMGYYLLVYAFTRFWLKSAALSLAVFLVAFRLQMMHYGVSPLAWIYPSATPVRFGLDILWLALLLAHLRTGKNAFLWAAAVYSGAAVYYMTSTGICVAAAFYFYLFSLALVPHLRRQYFPGRAGLWKAAGAGLLALAAGFALFWLTLGHWALSPVFWRNMMEYLTFFAHGHGGGVLPIYESLKYRNYWASFMGFALPLLYLFTLLYVGILICRRKVRPEYLLAVVIAAYGLANYQYYVVRSAMTSYYTNGLPFVLLSAFWLSLGLRRLPGRWAQRAPAAALALSVYALVTNHNYISYPNLFNFSRNPMVDTAVAQLFPDRQGYFNHQVKAMKEQDKLPVNSLGETDEDIRIEQSFRSDRELKEYFHREFDFSEDAALIERLTPPQQGVALLSSFETKILMQARRPPFFYHVPMISSQPMRMRAWPPDAAHSPHFLSDSLKQLQTGRPPYIFVEKVFLQDKIPAGYATGNPNISTLVAYIRGNYAPVAEGRYLAALKRKE